VEGANSAVMTPGTGVGEAFLAWKNGEYRAHSSGDGHADFAPSDGIQMRLLEFMSQRLDHGSYEHVCSGVGIPHGGEDARNARDCGSDCYDRTMAIIQSAIDPTEPSPR
jgi:glucokinase